MFVTLGKVLGIVLLTFGVIAGGSGAFWSPLRATAPAPKKTDKENIQGTWIAVSAEAEGKALPEREVKGFKVVISNDKVVFTEDRSCTYKLDAKKTPKVIVLTPLDGPAKGKPQRAIYELTGDRLKLCVQNGNGDPPTKFATKRGSGLRLLVLKRVNK